MKLLIYTANLGNFDRPVDHVEQELPDGIDLIEYWRCTDEDFPPRFNAMTPRLQARIVKMFGWQFKPDYDFYLWVDSSCRLPRVDSAKWFMEKMGICHMVAFAHNKRKTIQEEADYLKQRYIDEKEGRKQPYVLPRYENEDIDGQLAVVDPNAPLFATTAFMYKNGPDVQKALKEWWHHTSRYHSIDQLSFSEVTKNIPLLVLEKDYLNCEYLRYVR